MNTCGTCKYFGAQVSDQDDWRIPTDYHRCGLIDLRDRHRKPSSEDPVAAVIDASGYYAALCVKEEFGCNQWQPKDPA